MGFVHPELLLLALPALAVWWRFRDASRATQAVRLVALLLLVAALAGPYLSLTSEGRDLVVVVDRSRSMPEDVGDVAAETLRLAQDARRTGDRVGVVTFGAAPAVEWLPDETRVFDGFGREVDADGSDLSEALDVALGALDEQRQGSLLVISDGEHDGREPLDAARRAFARGVRVDVRPLVRPPGSDVSVERLDLPQQVDVGEPFQFAAWLRSDARTEVSYTLWRGGVVLSRGTRSLEPGRTPLLFRDRIAQSGVAQYRLELRHEGDRIPENDRGRGAVVAHGERRLLVLNTDGATDTLVAALRGGGLAVDARTPEEVALDPLTLLSWRAVVLENVSASRLGRGGLAALADYVSERGGGLMMTGGKASFGVGGYHLTPVDPLLPVSMEVRTEHRKQGVSLVLVLDRSGSMGAPAGGTTKMDLANQGAVAAVALLSELDSVAVVAVDSSPHVVVGLTKAGTPSALSARVRSIQAGGGGIYVRTGLDAAARLLAASPHQNRHIVLFADAADAEEQVGAVRILEALPSTTLSVIALGTEQDPDAAFLRDLARRGGGEAYFTTRAGELPRLFAQDTLMVARSTFVEEETNVVPLSGLFGLGELAVEELPAIGGYNLNYLRPEGTVGAVATDEYTTPILAYRFAGVGRTLAYGGQVGGTFGASLTAWDGFATLFVTAARWLAGSEPPGDLFVSARREGSEALVTVEVDRTGSAAADVANLVARLRHPDGEYDEHGFERVGQARYEARFPLRGAGVTLGTLRLPDGRFQNLPPIVLPYSPEFEHALDPAAGERGLRELARRTGGEVSPPADTLFRGDRASRAHRVVSRELALATLLILLLEIAARRLGLWSALAPAARRRADEEPGERPRRMRRPAKAPEPAPAPSAPPPGASAPAARQRGDVASALERARRSAGRKLDRGPR